MILAKNQPNRTHSEKRLSDSLTRLSATETSAGKMLAPMILGVALLAPGTQVLAQESTGLDTSAQCSVTAATLSESRTVYAQSCEAALIDCDFVDGLWQCASFQIGSSRPGVVIAPASTASTSVEPSVSGEPAITASTDEEGTINDLSGSNARCAVAAETLSESRLLYAATCTLARNDCDLIDGRWVCASFNINSGTLGLLSGAIESNGAIEVVSTPAPAPSTNTATSETTAEAASPVAALQQLDDSAFCSVSASTLAGSRILYEQTCSLPRADCDFIDGQWTCAAFQMNSAPATTVASNSVSDSAGSGDLGSSSNSDSSNDSDSSNNNTNTPSNSIANTNTGIRYNGRFGTPRRGWADSYSVNGVCYIASTLDHGVGNIQVQTPVGRLTVRQIASAIRGPGVGNNPIYNDVQCGNGPANNVGDEDRNQCPGRVDLGNSGCSIIGPLWDLSVLSSQRSRLSNIAIESVSEFNPLSRELSSVKGGVSALSERSRFTEGDLISLHFDSTVDSNDAHAIAATRMVTDYYGLGDSVHVVNGTVGKSNGSEYLESSETVMRAAFGDDNSADGWWDARAFYDWTVAETADQWLEVLQSGNRVWVAEGGPSDFTADVIREVSSVSTSNLRNIVVIQQSASAEGRTGSDNLALVQSTANYLKIPAGDVLANGTTGLSSLDDAVSDTFTTSARFGSLWQSAFDALPAVGCGSASAICRFDGADAVSLLYIVGDESLFDWRDFGTHFYQ